MIVLTTSKYKGHPLGANGKNVAVVRDANYWKSLEKRKEKFDALTEGEQMLEKKKKKKKKKKLKKKSDRKKPLGLEKRVNLLVKRNKALNFKMKMYDKERPSIPQRYRTLASI